MKSLIKPLVIISSVSFAALYIYLSARSYETSTKTKLSHQKDALVSQSIYDTIYYKDSAEYNKFYGSNKILMSSSKSISTIKLAKVFIQGPIHRKEIGLKDSLQQKREYDANLLRIMSSKTMITPSLIKFQVDSNYFINITDLVKEKNKPNFKKSKK